jgi:hypothetical protein
MKPPIDVVHKYADPLGAGDIINALAAPTLRAVSYPEVIAPQFIA